MGTEEVTNKSAYLIKPVQQDGPHARLQVGVVVKHAGVPLGAGARVALAHAVPYISRVCPGQPGEGALTLGQGRAGGLVGAGSWTLITDM